MLLIEGVVKEFPVPSAVPPEAAAYQSIADPAAVVADKVTVPVPQRVAGVVDSTLGTAFTVAVTAVLVETQPVVVLRAAA